MTLRLSPRPILFLFLFSFISYVQTSYSQTLNIVYERKINKYHEEELRAFPGLEKFKYFERFTLSISGKQSKFTLDSVIAKNWPEGFRYNSIVPYQNTFKNYRDKTLIEQTGRLTHGHGFQQELYNSKYTWIIGLEAKMIAGLKCQKVVSNTGAIAFFSEDLRFPDGPDKRTLALPGVVLYFEHPRYIYKAVDIYYNDAIIDIPDLTLTNNLSSILMSFDELRALEAGTIHINKESPINVWLKFQ